MSVTRTGDRVGLALTASLVVGLAVSVQSRINAQLALQFIGAGEPRTAAGFHSAVVSFGTGLILLLVLLVLLPRLRSSLAAIPGALRAGRLRGWHLLGGIFGAWLVATQGLTVPTLGVAVFTIAVVAGQVFGSLGVDAAGLGPAGPLRPSAHRVVGSLIALGAVAIAVAPRLGGSAGTATGGLGLLVLSAGLGISLQQALNAHVSVVSGWPLAATMVNFVVGTLVLATGYTIGHLTSGWTMAPLPPQVWLYVGGPLGVAFIAMAAWVVPVLGVLRFGLASICGQLAGGALLDLLFPQPGVVLGWQMLAGVLLTLLAVGVANRR